MRGFSSQRLFLASVGVLFGTILSGCGSLISDRFDAKALDRVNGIEGRILTQFDRLLNTPLVCRPSLISGDDFKNSYGDIEVLLRVHQSSEQFRPANSESVRIAGMFLTYWQIHRASHTLWNVDSKVRTEKLGQLEANLKKQSDQGEKNDSVDTTEATTIEIVPDFVMATRTAYAFKTCELAKKGAFIPSPRSDLAPPELKQMHTGPLGDAALQNSRDQISRYVRAAMVIEEARKLVLSQPKTGKA